MSYRCLFLAIVALLFSVGCKDTSAEEARKDISEATGNAMVVCIEMDSDVGERIVQDLRVNGNGRLHTFFKIHDRTYCRGNTLGEFARYSFFGKREIKRLTLSYMADKPHELRTVEIPLNHGMYEFMAGANPHMPVIDVAPRTSADPVLLPPGIPR